MNDTKISVYFVTLNEAETIASAIKSVRELDEIIVVDSGSTDGTVQIAQELGATVIHQDWLGFARQKAFALSQCRNEWCFNLDGDEVVPPETLNEIRQVVENGSCDLIRIPFEDIFMGRPMHPWSRKRTIIRVFKKSHVEYPLDRIVHENVLGKGKVLRVNNTVTHYGYDSVDKLMEKQNKYASLMAQSKFEKGRRSSLLKLIFVFPFVLFKVYFLRKLFLSGRRGFIQSYIEAMYAFLKESCLYELGVKARRK